MKPIFHMLLLSIVLLYSCNNHKKESNTGVKINMPTQTEIYRPFDTDTNKRPIANDHSRFKIYTYINTSCSSCILKLKGWDKFQSENPDFSQVPIIPVCFSRDSFELLKFLVESHKLPTMHLAMVLDLKDSFARLNNTLVRSGDFTALTDAEDNVLYTGDPLTNENVKNRFLNAVHNAE
jgi:hypothetical protein